jgi:hypothetical protein
MDISDHSVSDSNSQQDSKAKEWPLLPFSTTSSLFTLRCGKDPFNGGPAFAIFISDADGKWCGSIVYDESWQFESETQYELILISEGVIPKNDNLSCLYPEYEYVKGMSAPLSITTSKFC